MGPQVIDRQDECAVKVTSGSSLYSIAELFGVKVKVLKAANKRLPLGKNTLYPPVGSWVHVPEPSKSLSHCATAPKGEFNYQSKTIGPEDMSSVPEIASAAEIASTGAGTGAGTGAATGSGTGGPVPREKSNSARQS